MIIEKSWVRNFRNYEKAEVVWHPQMNVITGNNAQGKTNLLESLVYLSLTRSHRTSNDRNMIRFGCEHAEIGCLFKDQNERRIDAVIHENGKTLMINRNPVKRSSEFIGLLNVILFSPDDLTLFNDSPGDRRRMINQEISKVSASYLQALGRYRNLLKNRNVLLKEISPNLNYLDTLDIQMVQEEKTIIAMRHAFIESIGRWITPLYRELCGSDDIEMNVRYISCIEDVSGDCESQLREMYRKNRRHDLDFHSTGAGIHREDMMFEMNGRNMIQTASQGQKRMTMLAFKMALLHYIEEKTGTVPVLLLDDVLSELDQSRQRKLIEMIKAPCQCFITSTDLPPFLNQENLQEYTIENGKVCCAGGSE